MAVPAREIHDARGGRFAPAVPEPGDDSGERGRHFGLPQRIHLRALESADRDARPVDLAVEVVRHRASLRPPGRDRHLALEAIPRARLESQVGTRVEARVSARRRLDQAHRPARGVVARGHEHPFAFEQRAPDAVVLTVEGEGEGPGLVELHRKRAPLSDDRLPAAGPGRPDPGLQGEAPERGHRRHPRVRAHVDGLPPGRPASVHRRIDDGLDQTRAIAVLVGAHEAHDVATVRFHVCLDAHLEVEGLSRRHAKAIGVARYDLARHHGAGARARVRARSAASSAGGRLRVRPRRGRRTHNPRSPSAGCRARRRAESRSTHVPVES